MSEGWAESNHATRIDPGAVASARAHRELLSAQFSGHTIVVCAGAAMLRNDDNNFLFRPDSDFLWLVGAAIEFAVLVMVPSGATHDSIVFMPEPARPGGADFFADRMHGSARSFLS